jgi:predicted SAM-dependent methyltransferase
VKLLRSTIELTNRALRRIKAGRRVAIPAGFNSVRINLGCGLAVTQGWINIDGSLNALVASMPRTVHRLMYRLTGARQYYSESEYCRLLGEHVFVHHDLSAGIPLNDGVADYIYSSHFFEHLYRKDAIQLLRECHRVLKDSAILRIAIPDLEHALSLYAAGRKDEMLQNYFFVEDNDNHYSRHKYMYDFQMLASILKDLGFRNITKCQFRVGKVADIDMLDNRADESLFVEASK